MRRLRTALLVLIAGCSLHVAPAPSSAGGERLSFALIGDTPYNSLEAYALDAMIEQMNREDLAFVIHVGDITSGRGPCSDEWFEARKRQFGKFRHATYRTCPHTLRF